VGLFRNFIFATDDCVEQLLNNPSILSSLSPPLLTAHFSLSVIRFSKRAVVRHCEFTLACSSQLPDDRNTLGGGERRGGREEDRLERERERDILSFILSGIFQHLTRPLLSNGLRGFL
jgi:hypothetical protein